ncbi:Adenylate kinase 7 [Amphibalanus amphitrite]|uniref:Adenylate kinase 7 n=1 Tax=Amphibalanus amphitrite TaxID=1232801 RepID=A0A6A4WE74_AMPAM|nr:Adenylate kinase 7 [Amphibalanus amphitrite]
MTWAKTKPLDPDDPDSPFTEDDYRRRRPHPHFQEHLNCEKTTFALGKTNKKKFKTYVIAAGATFGKGEDIFHSWMKQAWHNEKELTIFGRGNNVVPTIHILDLAQVVQCVFDTRPTTRYILAVDGLSNTQREIVKAISSELSTGQDVTVLNFFDELEVHPLLVDVTKDESEGMEDTCRLLQKRLGAPRNYGLTKEEAEEKRQRQEAERLEQERQAREEAERCAREEMDSRRREQMVWMERLTEVKRQELEALEARSLPLRSYLMKHVIPTLTQGLLECAKVKPEDPVDYLAEYLFTNNPQTNLVEWEELQKSKLEAKEAARKQMMDNWLAEDTVEHVGREAPVAEGGTEPEASEHTSANTSHETVDASPKSMRYWQCVFSLTVFSRANRCPSDL